MILNNLVVGPTMKLTIVKWRFVSWSQYRMFGVAECGCLTQATFCGPNLFAMQAQRVAFCSPCIAMGFWFVRAFARCDIQAHRLLVRLTHIKLASTVAHAKLCDLDQKLNLVASNITSWRSFVINESLIFIATILNHNKSQPWRSKYHTARRPNRRHNKMRSN